MPADVEQLRRHLQAFDLSSLLIEELGWDRYHARPVSIQVDGATYTLEPAAEKAGFVVYICGPDSSGGIPPYPIRRKIERQAARVAYEHMVVFVDGSRTAQVWQWVKRESGKPAACREMEYRQGQRGDALAIRLQAIAVDLDEEERLQEQGISAVALRVQQAFDVERVTKRFYDLFKGELETFRRFIEGIASQGDREWYASLMLNRMMFVYFIQKQGFLDGDPDYLRNRLNRLQAQSGKGRFQQFYRLFLLRLFHEGLGQPEAERAPDLADLLGKVPYLNGGLFDVHDLERANPDIQIPDEAFEKVFDFFDRYRWHLDERPHRADNEINPDVLGYIFEKYINQKQMGAYYTKEDITGYIARNTVIPFLFDAARKECPVAFAPGGGVWRLLRENPDRYLYPAVGHGVTWDARQTPPQPLEQPHELPEEIATGISDVSQTGGWNRPAPEDYGLPTETWREVVARRQRHQEVRAKLAAGEVQDINDLITLNVDICQFAEDVIVQSEGPELLRAFWHAIREVSILDPACGSGAFLFAALNILEPLYTACIEGMRGLLDDLDRSGEPHRPEKFSDFRKVLQQADDTKRHPNERYFILKSIVLNNLYGVDIMEEAVEICKLRLFLKLVAQVESYEQIEPLPDIDFNIRAGNTLAGFTSLEAVRDAMTMAPNGQHRMLSAEDEATLKRIEEDAEIADWAFQQFKESQSGLGMDAGDFRTGKELVRESLTKLRDQLDGYLATEYGIDLGNPDAYAQWRAGHQPFHWFVEFYGIMRRGGFDVVIGNPPYVEYSKVRKEYRVRGFSTESSGNLYALFTERSYDLLGLGRRFGYIVQAPIVSTQRMAKTRELLSNRSGFITYATFDDRPSKLFNGMYHCRVCIILSLTKRSNTKPTIATTRYHKWYEEESSNLFPLMRYQPLPADTPNTVIPKLRSSTELSIYRKVLGQPKTLGHLISATSTEHRIYYKITGVGHWFTFTTSPPKFWRDGTEGSSTRENSVSLPSLLIRDTAFCCLWSTLHYWLYQARTNCRDFNPSDLEGLPIPASLASGLAEFEKLAAQITDRLEETSDVSSATYSVGGAVRFQRFRPKLAKPLIDEIDRVLAQQYGFTSEELDFIINYDIKYRMGVNGGEEDDPNDQGED